MQRSSELKSFGVSNTVSVQLDFMVAASFLPFSVRGGRRPFLGSTISEVWRSGTPPSNQWPLPSLLAFSSFSAPFSASWAVARAFLYSSSVR